MDKNTKKSHLYQLCSFISKKKHLHFHLTSYEISILLILCRYWDMPKGECFGKQSILGPECGMSERHFKRSSKKLADLKIIERALRGRLYYYYPGENFYNIGPIGLC